MENPAEEEAARRWKAQAEREERDKRDADTPAPKRRRITNGSSGQQKGLDVGEVRQFMISDGSRKQKKKTARELADEDWSGDDLEEVDWSGAWKSPIQEVQRR